MRWQCAWSGPRSGATSARNAASSPRRAASISRRSVIARPAPRATSDEIGEQGLGEPDRADAAGGRRSAAPRRRRRSLAATPSSGRAARRRGPPGWPARARRRRPARSPRRGSPAGAVRVGEDQHLAPERRPAAIAGAQREHRGRGRAGPAAGDDQPAGVGAELLAVVGRPHERRLGAVERARPPRRPRDAEHDGADTRAELVTERVVGPVHAVRRRDVGEEDHEGRGDPEPGERGQRTRTGMLAGGAAQPQICDAADAGSGLRSSPWTAIVSGRGGPRQSDHAWPSCALGMARSAPRGDNRAMPDDDRAPVLAFPQAPDAIELRHLRAFVAVAEELNFGRAADRLHLSQSALSRQVRGLEQLLGCDLLRRSTHSVELTIAGEALLDRARRLLTDVDEAVSVTLSIGGELAGRLTQLWAPLFAVANANGGLQAQRNAYEQFHAQFAPPPEVAITPVNAGGVPSFELTTDPDALPTLLYLHGGGHVMGSAFGHKPLMGALAVAAGARVLAPEFRLAPGASLPRGSRGRAPRVSVDARDRDPGRAGGPGRRLGGLWPGDVAPAEPQAAEPAAPGRGAAVLPLGRPQQHGALVAGRHRRAGRDAARAGPRLRRRVPRRAPARRSRHQPPDRGPLPACRRC